MSNGEQLGQGSSSSPLENSSDLQESSRGVSSGTFGSSGAISNPSASSGQGNSEPADSASEDERIRILGELEDAMESFRGRQRSKADVISSILQILGDTSNLSLTQTQKNSTFDSYLSEIQSIDSSIGEPRISEESQHHRGSTPQPEDAVPRSRKHLELSDSDGESDDDSSSKRQKLSESDMSWFKRPSDSITSPSNPS